MSICVLHPNFGCLIWCCALFCQNASGVYASGPGPWEVSLASSRTLWIMTGDGFVCTYDAENGKNTQGGNSSIDYSASLEGQSNERGPVLRQLATWLLQVQ